MARPRPAAANGILLAASISGPLASGTIVFSDGPFSPGSYSTGFTYIQTAESNIGWEPAGGRSPGSVEVAEGVLDNTFNYDPATEGDLVSLSAFSDRDFTVNIDLSFDNSFFPIGGPALSGTRTAGHNTLNATGLAAGNFGQVVR